LLSSAADQRFGVAGDSLEGESPGEFRFVSSELVPGFSIMLVSGVMG